MKSISKKHPNLEKFKLSCPNISFLKMNIKGI
jgi:hypothetical protein